MHACPRMPCHGWIDGSAEWGRRDSGRRTPETVTCLARLANGLLLGLDVALHGISLSYGLSLKSSQLGCSQGTHVHALCIIHPSLHMHPPTHIAQQSGMRCPLTSPKLSASDHRLVDHARCGAVTTLLLYTHLPSMDRRQQRATQDVPDANTIISGFSRPCYYYAIQRVWFSLSLAQLGRSEHTPHTTATIALCQRTYRTSHPHYLREATLIYAAAVAIVGDMEKGRAVVLHLCTHPCYVHALDEMFAC